MNKLVVILLLILCDTVFAQTTSNPYFPLAIGNRWDFSTYTTYFQHYPPSSGTYSTSIIDTQSLSNGKKYFVFSKIIQVSSWPPSWSTRFRLENNKIYTSWGNEECLVFDFDSLYGSSYQICNGTRNVDYYSVDTTFGKIDTVIGHLPYKLSKNFGIKYNREFIVVGYTTYILMGCIINGVQYGTLLVSSDEQNNVPKTFLLQQNYPNPFNPVTIISYEVPQTAVIELSVYNTLGEKICELVHEEKTAGHYETEFNASQLPGGVYFYRINSGGFSKTMKMILLK